MSDKIDSLALGSWLALTTFQIGVSIKEAWEKRMRQRSLTDYEHVANGETRNGWRQVMAFRNPEPRPSENYCVLRPWLIGDDYYREDAIVRSGFSVDIRYSSPMPDGRTIFNFRRCSLIRPARKTLLQVMHRDKDFSPACVCGYANARTKYSVFHWPQSENFYILLTDAIHGKACSFVVVPPEQGVQVWFIYECITKWPKCRFHVVFRMFRADQALQAEVFDVIYDLSIDSTSSQPQSPLSWESILVPVGGRSGNFSFRSDQAQTWVIYENDHIDDTDAHLCISFDHTKSWRVESLTKWLTSLRVSKAGSSVLESMQSFEALSPPVDWYYSLVPLPALRFLHCLAPFGNVVFGLTHGGGLWLRWRIPPSLKRVAIEAVFRAKPDLKMAQLKEASGFDFDDGIPDDSTEDDVDVIHLG